MAPGTSMSRCCCRLSLTPPTEAAELFAVIRASKNPGREGRRGPTERSALDAVIHPGLGRSVIGRGEALCASCCYLRQGLSHGLARALLAVISRVARVSGRTATHGM